jgi:hypothetical protein
MRLRDMKYIGFKHQRENKQNSDNSDFYQKCIIPLYAIWFLLFIYKFIANHQCKTFVCLQL